MTENDFNYIWRTNIHFWLVAFMISSRLKSHFIQKKTAELLKKAINNRIASNEEIHSVGILTENDLFNELELQELVIEKLGLRNPKIYSYRKYDKNEEKSYKHFSKNDFNWKGDVIEPSLSNFVEQPFDLLICLYPKKHSYLEYTTLLSEARFKVGFAEVNENLFDLEISVQSNQVDGFLAEAKKYLSILEKL